jgi:hypothetical protein
LVVESRWKTTIRSFVIRDQHLFVKLSSRNISERVDLLSPTAESMAMMVTS